MSDYSKLKELAEAAGGVSWEWWTSNSTLRLTTESEGRHGADGDAISAYQSSVECPEKYRDFIAAANPAVVLGLIAEIERLSGENQRLRAGVESDLAEVDRIQGEYDKQWRKARELRTERDTLKAECEGLRKDAERFRHLMFSHVDWTRNGKDDDLVTLTFGPYPSHKLRETLDAAMSKGERS